MNIKLTPILSLNKYIYSAAFILSFISFLTADIFFNPLIQIFKVSSLAICFVELFFLMLSIILFFILIKKILYSDRPLLASYSPLTSSFKNVDDPLLMIRFFAFWGVIVTHCAMVFNVYKKLELPNTPWKFLLGGCAKSGMIIFFCMSGYLMGKAFFSKRYLSDSSGIKSFYANRVLRIVPLCYFAMFICTVFSCPECPDLLNHLSTLWRSLLFLYYGNTPGTGPIGAFWALSVEMQYYILAPFIFILFGRFLNTKTRACIFMLIVLVLGLGSKYILFIMNADWMSYRYKPLYANLDFFLVGFGINGLIEQDRQNIQEPKGYKKNAAVAFILCFLIYLIGSKGEVGLMANPIYIDAILLMSFFLIYNVELYKVKRKFITDEKTCLFHRINKKISKILQILGLLTYGLYVWHSPILETYNKMISPNYTLFNYFVICAKGSLLVLILSIITYYIIERPSEKYKI